ncbi:PTS sugar transporter subunit IIA [Pontibacillus salicampi]|uniref:Ascorbate-specific PTS system EIIA component n=1 Tax=Pontibacillus salicampi TaxID=1449801 RepID=A0ABV6LRS3_9BACI
MVQENIKKENIITHVKVSDWKEAIQVSGNLLVNNGYISQKYINQMIQSVKDHGPYIVIGPGIALAHARPSQDVFHNAISLAILTDGVDFGHETNDPVDLVFTFSASDANKHLNIMERLSKILLDESTLSQVRTADSPEIVYQLLNYGRNFDE